MASIHPARRAFAVVAGIALVALPLVALQAAPAQAETPGVVASCAGLTVKPNGYAAKGELRIVIDGEVQTDGDESGWTTFKGSYPGVYTFEPNLPHTYAVEIDSFADDSAGRSFEPGTGGDVRIAGTTTPCSPVVVTGAGSNCTSASGAGKQSMSLEFSGLRRSVTYLSEVLDADGEVVKHFQFRTAPVVEHRFTGLSAGSTYTARVTDQSNPVLSGSAIVRIGDCATTPTVSLRFSPCSADRRHASLRADLSDLVAGRDYGVDASAGSPRERTLRAAGPTATTTFAGLVRGTDVVVTVADEDAPRSIRIAATVPSCGTAAGGSGASAPSSGAPTPPKNGSGPSQPGGSPSSGTTAPGGSSTPGGTTPGGTAPGGSAAPGGTPHAPTAGSSRPAGPSGAGAPGSSVAGAAGAASTASPAAVAAAADAAGPGDSGSGTAVGGSSAGGGGLVAATDDQRIDRVPAAAIGVVLALVLVLGVGALALVRRRRAH
ncbi:hypothetical protein [Amnibacterium kyonggiense]|uniref:Uncharacterized protein n=1 Tax=Amnibacterium kyonggiense TaxID=595671 RepID=A0A4R7FSM0_9MICO|nr:hypothetical protein [Amnibacterium kyonggiense]TDS80861.1 hypothetical protein CLV52_1431 [Amnibacterium kyonggiense]